MESCDQITIECNRKQAVVADETVGSSWVNTLPSIILNEGDQIECLGSWLSTRNAGDQSIQIVDLENPSQNIDISFKFSFYKCLNGQNVVTFPYHSFQFTQESTFPQNLIHYGFTSDPVNQGETQYGLSNQVYYPKINDADTVYNPYVNSTYYSTSMASHARYSTLVNEQDADVYNEATSDSYILYLSNANLRQGIRDEAANNNRYTACYEKTNGKWEIYTHTVAANLEPSYLTPENLSSFITESMNQSIKLVSVYEDTKNATPIKEVWTNSFRYFKSLEPFALPNLNTSTIPSGYHQKGTGDANKTTIGSYGSISHDLPSQTGYVTNLTINVTDITYDGTGDLSLTNRGRIRGTYAPSTEEDARMFHYVYNIAHIFG